CFHGGGAACARLRVTETSQLVVRAHPIDHEGGLRHGGHEPVDRDRVGRLVGGDTGAGRDQPLGGGNLGRRHACVVVGLDDHLDHRQDHDGDRGGHHGGTPQPPEPRAANGGERGGAAAGRGGEQQRQGRREGGGGVAVEV